MRDFVKFGRKIVCVGRNYPCHVAEMKGNVEQVKLSPPLLFLKPPSSFVEQPQPIRLPTDIGEVHHEVEVGVVIGRKAEDVEMSKAMQYVSGYFLALDLTARDLQQKAKEQGLPWTLAKGYDTFCPVSMFLPKVAVRNIEDVPFYLNVNGERRQQGNTKNMIHSIPRLIAYISRIMQLNAGDVILTGTPSGVGPLRPGDLCKAVLGNQLVSMEFRVLPRPASAVALFGPLAQVTLEEK